MTWAKVRKHGKELQVHYVVEIQGQDQQTQGQRLQQELTVIASLINYDEEFYLIHSLERQPMI